ncbi:MAG: [FeFe] hydrogenase H-cluster radical SAM maturase HydG [Pseudomonadota bacterium]
MPDTFIDDKEIFSLLHKERHASVSRIEEVISRARTMKGLEPIDVAALLSVEDEDVWQEIFCLAKEIKNNIYGNRIVLFAPLYTSNRCANDCAYCGFRRSNEKITRHTLSTDDIAQEVLALENAGHKRLLMVYGEHPAYGINYIAKTIETAYRTKASDGRGEIRRININAAPMEKGEYEILKKIGIGTYQVFQETYHKDRYADIHPDHTIKGDYHKRLYTLHQAQEAKLDDVGIGVLFGLYDWRFEVMGILAHSMELEKQFGVGPHTISFPRLEPAINTPFYDETPYHVSDEDLKKIVAIIRLMVPYTGMILTAREKPVLRRELMHLGVSQIDGGSRIDVGGYHRNGIDGDLHKQQFTIYDNRSLDDIVRELAHDGFIPSFCTACYRSNRTGERFMQMAKSVGTKGLCHPNAILTFYEYILDYASDETHKIGKKLIQDNLSKQSPDERCIIEKSMADLDEGKRDEFF